MTGTENMAVQKILSRFDGNTHEAIAYCMRVSIEHPQFAKEYEDYARMILGKIEVD